jgi:hypothetical protein
MSQRGYNTQSAGLKLFENKKSVATQRRIGATRLEGALARLTDTHAADEQGCQMFLGT